MFIIFPRLLADILGFSGAVGLSVIVSAMEVRTNIKGGHKVNCKSAKFRVRSENSFRVAVSKPHIRIFFINPQLSKFLMFASLKSTKIFTIGHRGWNTSLQQSSHENIALNSAVQMLIGAFSRQKNYVCIYPDVFSLQKSLIRNRKFVNCHIGEGRLI
jgi:hypothetical protein